MRRNLKNKNEIYNLNGIYSCTFVVVILIVLISYFGLKYQGKDLEFFILSGFSVFVFIEWLIGKIIYKYIKNNNKLMLLVNGWKLLIFNSSLTLMIITIMITQNIDICIHIIILIVLNIINMPVCSYLLKQREKVPEIKFYGYLIVLILQMVIATILTKILYVYTNDQFMTVIVYYILSFATVIINMVIYIASIHQYINYDKINNQR